MNFEIPEDKLERLNKWCAEQDEISAKMQEEDELLKQLQEDVGISLPYYGATGGCLKFIFIPCSIGMTIKVEHLFTHNELDLTDVEDW